MKHFAALAAVLISAAPVLAQHSVVVFADAEGVHRSSGATFDPNTVKYVPRFDNGGGLGFGLNFFSGERVSLEAKVAVLQSRLHVRRSGSDYVTVADLGYAQIYPVTAVLQWHMLEGTALRPYIGAGAGYVILRDIAKPTSGLGDVKFDNPIGLVVDGGLEISLSKRWSVLGDARYTPIESRSYATFIGTSSKATIHVKPLIVSTGIAFRF